MLGKNVPPFSHLNAVIEIVTPWIELTIPALNGGVGEFFKTMRPPLQSWTRVLEKNPPFGHFNVVVEIVITWIELTIPTLKGGVGEFSKTIRQLPQVPDGNPSDLHWQDVSLVIYLIH